MGLCVFVVPERWAVPLSEPVAGIARGLEVLEIVRLDAPGRTAVARHLGPARRGRAAHAHRGVRRAPGPRRR